MTQFERRIITPLPAATTEIGRWLWALEDCRDRTIRTLEGLTQTEIDWTAPGIDNSIGTLLYHIALIEADYLCIDILGRNDYFEDLQAILPFPDRDDGGRLTVVAGIPLAEHLSRLDTIRQRFLEIVSRMSAEQYESVRELPDWNYEISPAWTLHHLMQDEAQHRGEIGAIRTLFQSAHDSK